MNSPALRVCLLGATGTIGRATRAALLARGHEVVCFARPKPGREAAWFRAVDVMDPAALARDGFKGERFDAVVSCMASRTGAPADAWAVDYQAHMNVLAAAKDAGVRQFVLLSAICVQKPKLAFQHAKLAFEQKLMESGLVYSIVRPTAFFKSLAGQIERVRQGKKFLLFGDGTITACKPVSDRDLGAYIADCLADETRWNRILPIGGPGPAITPRAQGEFLFATLGQAPRFQSVPPAMLSVIIGVLSILGRVNPALAEKAELARIGRYYATESMLWLNPETGAYDAAGTPETGTDMLFDYYQAVLKGAAEVERGEHAVF